MTDLRHGEIWLADLGEVELDKNGRPVNSFQRGIRPVILSSNNACLKFSSIITVTPITSKMNKAKLPTHVCLGKESGLEKQSVALVEQIKPIEKKDLIKKIGKCDFITLKMLKVALNIQGGFVDKTRIENLVSEVNKYDMWIEVKNLSPEEVIPLRNEAMLELKCLCELFKENMCNLFKYKPKNQPQLKVVS